MRALNRLVAVTFLTMFSGAAGAQQPSDGKEFVVFTSRETVSFDRMAEELAKADVVFVGENHDHKLGHQIELAILKALHLKRPKLALSLEFFERDVQGVLDEYLQGHITETHFRQSSRPWPTYATDYAPMVEYCKINRLPVVAANAPRRYVNIVSRKGRGALKDLSRESRRHLPRLPFEMDIPEGYNRMLDDLFGGAHGGGGAGQGMSPESVVRIKEAQGLWDATMADLILRARRDNRRAMVLQMNGAGHSDSGWGIVDRLRKADSRLKIKIVSIKPDSGFPRLTSSKYDGVADYLILTGVEAEKPSR